MRLPLALALATALCGSAWADQIGVRQTLECRGEHCIPSRVYGDLSEPSTQGSKAQRDGTRPDDRLTPGEVRTTDRAEICATRTGAVRDVSDIMKIAARRAYGLMNNRAGWCAPNGCEIDHRVPLEIGGGNARGSIANLWPERATGPHNFHDKDRCENAAHKAICDGALSVPDAQAIFLGDWVAGCAALMESR